MVGCGCAQELIKKSPAATDSMVKQLQVKLAEKEQLLQVGASGLLLSEEGGGGGRGIPQGNGHGER